VTVPAPTPRLSRGGATDTASVVVRRMRPGDEESVLDLMRLSLGWRPEDPNASFFAWKHYDNPFGASPSWVALDGSRLVGFRTFMRWEFTTPSGVVRAVRAVDTATHPDHQGRGIFSLLTRHAVNELIAEGVGFVFNTPNDKSRPGYLKMGWRPVGHLPAGLRPRSVASWPRIAAARVPADLWSSPTEAGVPAAEALADSAAVSRLLASVPVPGGVATHRTPAYLAWRYGFDPLAYRALLAGARVEDGLLLFRLRRRGAALELSVGDVLLPRPSSSVAGRLLKRALRQTGADYALGMRTSQRTGLLPLPGQGPLLTWRALTEKTPPSLGEWRLTLGDVELF
jgi:GNAT superfamily N-acetyltransferase